MNEALNDLKSVVSRKIPPKLVHLRQGFSVILVAFTYKLKSVVFSDGEQPQRNVMARIVIVGAGLTGISTAYHLEKREFFSYEIFEKEATYGGLCRSITQDGFTFDYTGHLLHASDEYFYTLIKNIVGIEQLNTITRRSFVYSQNRYTHYPFQINLHGLPNQTIAECIIGYINRPHAAKPTTFSDWVLSTFGTGFAKYFFFPYQQKIFAHNIRHLTAQWTQRFVPSTSLEQILYGALSAPDFKQEVGYNARFLYPKRGGIIRWVQQLANQLLNPIHTHHAVQRINMNTKTITFSNGHIEPYDVLISTMPLDHLIAILYERPSTHLAAAKNKLLCNQVINMNIGINRPDISDKHWVYFPETIYPFYRVGFWHNFSEHMTPPGCSALYGEFAFKGRSRRWINRTIKDSLQMIKQLYNIGPNDVATEKIITISHAYVTYDQWREQNLPALLKRLEEYDIFSVGRYGAWKYSSMQEAVLDGKAVADQALARLETKPFLAAISRPMKGISTHE